MKPINANAALTNALTAFSHWYANAWPQPLPPLDEQVRRTRAWCAFEAGWTIGARFVVDNEKKEESTK